MSMRKAEPLIVRSGTPFLNGLAGYYTLSGLFFELDYDIIVTGNEQYADAEHLHNHGDERRMLTECINGIIDGTPYGDPSRKDSK